MTVFTTDQRTNMTDHIRKTIDHIIDTTDDLVFQMRINITTTIRGNSQECLLENVPDEMSPDFRP